MSKKAFTISALSLAAGLMGASMAYAAEAPVAHADKSIIRLTTAQVFGQSVTLAKYEQGGKVCQQFVSSASQTETGGQFTQDIRIDEVCDVPEMRLLADGTKELFPRKLASMVPVDGEDTHLELPQTIVRGL